MEKNTVKISEVLSEISIDKFNNKKMLIRIMDNKSKKSVSYLIFEKNKVLWDTVINKKIEETNFKGKIIELPITMDIIKRIEEIRFKNTIWNLDYKKVIEEGFIFNMVFWELYDGMERSHEELILLFLNGQFWRLKKELEEAVYYNADWEVNWDSFPPYDPYEGEGNHNDL